MYFVVKDNKSDFARVAITVLCGETKMCSCEHEFQAIEIATALNILRANLKTPCTLSRRQKYGLASALSVNLPNSVKTRILEQDFLTPQEKKMACDFIDEISPMMTKHDGFVPKKVIRLINS